MYVCVSMSHDDGCVKDKYKWRVHTGFLPGNTVVLFNQYLTHTHTHPWERAAFIKLPPLFLSAPVGGGAITQNDFY